MGLQAVIHNRLLTIFSALVLIVYCMFDIGRSVQQFLGNAFHTVHNEETLFIG